MLYDYDVMSSTPRYSIEEGIFVKAPSFCRAVVVARNVDNSQSDPKLMEELAKAVQAIAANPSTTPDHPRISAWQEVYKTFPTPKGERIRPSIAALVSRIRGGVTALPFISPLVAISNIISLSYLMPSGLIDFDKVEGDLILGIANGSETFMPFGKDHLTSILPGEIVYYASGGRTVLCRSWNYRGSKQSGIQPATRTAVIDIDALMAVADLALLHEAVNQLTSLILSYCGGETETYFLNARNPNIELKHVVRK